MRKSMMILLLCMVCTGSRAQENKAFVSAGLGTQATDKALRGASVSMEGGYNWKGLDLSAYLGYYSNHWGGQDVSTLTLVDTHSSDITSYSLNGRLNVTGMSLRLNVGYDVLRFIKGNWRHHLRPYLGLGYSQLRESGYSLTDGSSAMVFQWNERTQHGFELAVGIGYDFSLTRAWSVGAFFEESTLLREQDVMGLRVRYAF